MSQPDSSAPLSLRERIRDRFGPRAVAIALALLVELLLALLLLTLAPAILTPEETVPMSTFTVSPEQEPAAEEPTPAKPAAADPRAARPTDTQPTPADPQPKPPAPTEAPPPPVMLNIPLSRMPDIASIPRSPAAPSAPRRTAAGPPNLGPASPDTPRVEGRGPNGEPLYAASWYREPYPSELNGYLSSAKGPGWALIACRTIRDYRVDSCVALAEQPDGSQIARAVLAAAWQFRVRPPRLGGEIKVGEWVRIRIDYGLRER